METNLSRFTRRCVKLAKSIVDEGNKPAEPRKEGGSAEWAMVSLYCLRLHTEKSESMYRTVEELPNMKRSE
jgi:hypothetical protein